MLNTIDRRLIVKGINTPIKWENELVKDILKTNVNREKNLSYILIVINIMLFFLDTLTKIIWGQNQHVFIPFGEFHIFLLLISLLFLGFVRIQDRYASNNIFLLKLLHIFINILVLVNCSLIGTENIMLGQQPFAYIIAIFCIAPLILLNSYERLLIFLVPYCIYIIHAILNFTHINNLIEVIFFSTLLNFLAFLVSRIIYVSYNKNFISNRIIEEKNKQLDEMYRKTEKKLKIRTEELNETIEYEKLRTNFFANISHELRTPLNVILSAEQMLRLKIFKTEYNEKQNEINKYMYMIKQNSYRLVRLVDNVIDSTKIDAGHFQVNLKNCNIVDIVENISLSVAKYIEDCDINLIFDTDVEEKIIACDADMIERIMLNLLSNAVKFTPKGGKIFVTIVEKESSITISIKDTGIGIPNNMKDSVFEKFIQVDKTSTRKAEGSGIGLSIVKSLVELHQGTISVTSEIGKGSEFIIELPYRIVESLEFINKNITNIENQYVEKISIEFSDIYY